MIDVKYDIVATIIIIACIYTIIYGVHIYATQYRAFYLHHST